MHKLISAVVLLGGGLFATSALAAPATLKCTGADMGPHFMYLWLDADANTVSVGRLDTKTSASSDLKTTVSEGKVAWDAAGSGGDIFHYTLNRNSGALAVTGDNYESGEIICKPDAGL